MELSRNTEQTCRCPVRGGVRPWTALCALSIQARFASKAVSLVGAAIDRAVDCIRFPGVNLASACGECALSHRLARAGAVLVHAHGTRCLTHEGAAVTAGVKYLLRTDVAYA